MPFGARHSPRVFTKALGLAMNYIRAHWQVRKIAHMDDIFILHQNPMCFSLATKHIALYLSSLGWTPSQEKCELSPKQEIHFLGWKWNFVRKTLEMTQEMRKSQLQAAGQ
jgi:hypothetical protein